MFVSVYCLNKCTIKIKNQVVLLIISTENHNILEYGSEVWDNCGAVNSDRLEKVQTEAARIVTGLTSYVIQTERPLTTRILLRLDFGLRPLTTKIRLMWKSLFTFTGGRNPSIHPGSFSLD
jgi:hypothetical protein